MASSLLAVDRILQTESQYREGIVKNHAASKMLADLLAIGGELSKSMQDAAADPSTNQEIEDFMNEQRERLQKISEKNVVNSRNVDAFVGALAAVRKQVQTTPETDESLDYERIIQDKMQQYSAANAESQVDVRDEKFCRDIRSSLGIKDRASKNKDDESDEELEVLRNPVGAQSLKCPITTMLYVEPLRNKVCGHVYSKAGIVQLLRSGKAKCPVAGCRNGSVTMLQLEEDVETEMKVKRQRRREETERQQRASQAIYDSEEEDAL